MPVISDASTSELTHQLERRKGGGGGGRGGGGGGKGGKGGGKAGGSRGGTSVAGLGGRTTSLGSRGGGAITTLPSGSRFAGREAGSGTRDGVYGGSYYGSGYPYGAYGSTWVGGRPFPFYYWPVYIGPHEYYGSSEYGPANSTERPGGAMSAISVYTTSPKYNTSDVYRILGDQSSVQVVLNALVSNCSVANGTIWNYDPSSDDLARSLPRVESIIQYYRASSFALALDGYNNSVALASVAPVNNSTLQLVNNLAPATPLPSTINRSFLECVNTTVAVSVPLIDAGLSNLPPVNGLGLLCLMWATFVMFQRTFL
ncbi:catalytic domain thiamine pyrophosphokinase [Ceratobasidium sp. AG-Ba]|nr:catalytic domain thiamine pyrophosphokinase [Ceratobasidium sp. AG-Ba]QRW11023.1 catalytic domain thiamin pyrophosphokinase [Ceratobasidium sp. AG-Ba]